MLGTVAVQSGGIDDFSSELDPTQSAMINPMIIPTNAPDQGLPVIPQPPCVLP